MKLKSKLITSKIGSLNEFDFKDFKIQRTFIVSDVPPGTIRGYHAHKNTQQYLCCISGKINITFDDGIKKEKIKLNKSEYVFQDKLIWSEIEFLDENSTLMVICSTKYSDDDYIRCYKDFKNFIKSKQIIGK